MIVLPLVGFGRAVRRRGRAAQDTLADASGYASELIGAVRVLQAFTNEKLAAAHFTAAVEQAYQAARGASKARAVLTAIAIFLASPAWCWCCGSARRTCSRLASRPAGSASSCSIAVFAAGGLGQL